MIRTIGYSFGLGTSNDSDPIWETAFDIHWRQMFRKVSDGIAKTPKTRGEILAQGVTLPILVTHE